MHSTYDSSRTNDSTYGSSRTNDSTSNSSGEIDSTTNRSPINDSNSNSRSEQINDCTHYNLSDDKIICDFIDSRKNNISYNEKNIPKMNSFLDKSGILKDNFFEITISQKEKRHYITIFNKIKNLNHFKKEVCNVIIKGINKNGWNKNMFF